MLDNRDPVPADTLACVRKQKLGADALERLARRSPAATRCRGLPRARRGWGRTSGVLLEGGRSSDYAVLALWNVDTPSLATGDVGRRVYESPGRFPVVSAETPVLGRLVRCAEKAG